MTKKVTIAMLIEARVVDGEFEISEQHIIDGIREDLADTEVVIVLSEEEAEQADAEDTAYVITVTGAKVADEELLDLLT